VLASASRAVVKRQNRNSVLLKIDGVDQTESIVLINSKRAPRAVTLEGQNLSSFEHNSEEKLLWVRFPNKPTPRYLEIQW
jgi:D-hexose-6-phosphate mutarotase